MILPILKQSPVRFDRESHTYWLGDKQLKGITSGSLIERLNPHKYDGVPEEKMKERREYGSMIHSLIELYEDIGATTDDPDLLHYVELKEQHHLHHLASEYIVSDEERYASPIDHVFIDEEGGIVLVDIKRTYKLDREAVRYQLTIYKRFFEMQTGLPVKTLAAIWLHGDEYAYVEVPPVADDIIDYLIECDIEDKPFDVQQAMPNLPAIIKDTQDEIVSIIRRMEDDKRRLEDMRKTIYKAMEQIDLKSFDGQKIIITRVLPTVRKTFDKTAFQKDYPEIYKEYIKDSNVSGTIKITVK